MIPLNFPESNKNLRKPAGWTDEECSSLPVYVDGNKLISCWQMTWRERISALFFGRVWLWVYSESKTQSPVALLATKNIFSKTTDEGAHDT